MAVTATRTRPIKDPYMSRPPFSWYATYEAAVLETDFARLHSRIDAALDAIEKRLDRLSKLEEAEFSELQSALRSLQALSADVQSA
jgi:hypothetical protein